uniref:C2H2-type domain-containing protein n=1 Tax=Castor canadensis TaxID=51338 RepID=A0A8C0W7Z2_CASCN
MMYKRSCERECGKCLHVLQFFSDQKELTLRNVVRKPCIHQECQKAFSCSISFPKHKKIHTGEKPYECEKYGETFSWSRIFEYPNDLILEEKSHT